MKNILSSLILFFLSTIGTAQVSSNIQKMQYYEYFNKEKQLLLNDIKINPANLDNYMVLGSLYSRLNNTDSATIIFNKLVEQNQKSALSYLAKGYMELNNGKADDAASFFERAAKMTKNKDGLIMRYIGEAYLFSPKHNYQQAIEYLKKAVAIEINNPVTYYSLGKAYIANNESGPAVTQFEFCTDYDKTAAWAYTQIGVIFESAKNYQKTEESYNAALKADPNYPLIYKYSAQWKFLHQDYATALEYFNKYQTMTGDNSIDAQTAKSTYLFYKKDYKKTIDIVNNIIKVDSSKNYMIRLLGYCYFEEGDSLAAKNMMEKFFQKAPKDKIIWSDFQYMGKIYQKFGNDSIAMIQYKKAIELDSTQVDIYDDLAKMNFKKANYVLAGDWFSKKLTKIKNPSIQNYFDIAFAYYKAEDYTKANVYFSKIVDVYPTSMTGQLYYARSKSYLDPESTEALAKPNYEKIIELGELDPIKYKEELKEAYKYLYYHYFNLEDKATALTFADKFIKVDPNDPEGMQLMDAAKVVEK